MYRNRKTEIQFFTRKMSSGMSKETLYNRLTLQKEERQLTDTGRNTAYGEEREAKLAKCIKTICNSGLALQKLKSKN